MNKTATYVAVIAVIAVVAVAAYVLINNNGATPEPKPVEGITIIDGNGNTVEIPEPIDSCMVISTSIPTAMKILNLQDKVDEILFKKASKYQEFHDAGFDISEDAPRYADLSTAEYFASKGVKYIIAPTNDKSFKASLVTSCESYGIKIIYLDCYGETMLDDMEKLVKLFGSTKETQDAFNAYLNLRNGIVEGVMSVVNPSDDKHFLFFMQGLDAFYNEEAELSKIVEKIYGKNAIRLLDMSPGSSVTVKGNVDGMLESLTDKNASTPVGLLLVRMSADDSADAVASKWMSTSIKNYNLDYIDGYDSEVYVIDSDLLSGPMDYIGYVAMAEVSGFETGYSVSELVSGYLELYGFHKDATTLIWNLTFDDDGDLLEVVDAGIE